MMTPVVLWRLGVNQREMFVISNTIGKSVPNLSLGTASANRRRLNTIHQS
jgi:hypothetical protein